MASLSQPFIPMLCRYRLSTPLLEIWSSLLFPNFFLCSPAAKWMVKEKTWWTLEDILRSCVVDFDGSWNELRLAIVIVPAPRCFFFCFCFVFKASYGQEYRTPILGWCWWKETACFVYSATRRETQVSLTASQNSIEGCWNFFYKGCYETRQAWQI